MTPTSLHPAGIAWETQWPRGVSSLQYLKMIEAAGEMGFCSFDFASGALTATRGFHWIHGSSPETMPKVSDLIKLVHPADLPIVEKMHLLVVSGQPTVREFRIIRPDGSVRWIELSAETILGADYLPIRTIGIVRDLTRRRDTTSSLAQVQDRYEALVRNVTDLVLTISPNSWMVGSARWTAMTGQSSRAASGDGWLNAVHADDRSRVRDAWLKARAEMTSFRADLRLMVQTGEPLRFDARLEPLRNTDGSVREWLGILSPIASGTRTAAGPPADPQSASGSPPPPGTIEPPLTAAELRGARGLLNWSIPDLAQAAGVSVSTIKRLECESADSGRGLKRGLIRKALEEAGVVFVLLPDHGRAQTLRRPAGT